MYSEKGVKISVHRVKRGDSLGVASTFSRHLKEERVHPLSPTPLPLPLQLATLQQTLTATVSESSILQEKASSSQTSLEEQTKKHEEEREHLLRRAEDLAQQNSLLHAEAEKLSAKVLTLQEQGREATPTLLTTTVTTETSVDQLWEIIR